jgi:hypothetical protein
VSDAVFSTGIKGSRGDILLFRLVGGSRAAPSTDQYRDSHGAVSAGRDEGKEPRASARADLHAAEVSAEQRTLLSTTFNPGTPCCWISTT